MKLSMTQVNVVALLVLCLLVLLVYFERESINTFSATLHHLGIVAGGLIAIWVAIWRGVVADRQAEASQQQTEISQRGLLNERYQKGADMLGSKHLSVRLRGIYALQQLAEEKSEEYHVNIMRLFCALVSRNPYKQRDDDVQAALAAIVTRIDAQIKHEKEKKFRLMLTNANLTDADLTNANLTTANLTDADLTKADLTNANLTGAKGLTQEQLNQAQADPNHPPKLDAPLEWPRGKPIK